MRRIAVLFAALLAVLFAAACARDAADAPKAQTLPPDGTRPVAELFNARLRPLGWEIQRASMEDREVPTTLPGKRHFAVYVRPLGTPTPNDYIEGLATVTKVFVPSVFEDYAELASFDVCLEPTAAEDPSAYPAAITQVLLSREQVAKTNWATATPADIIRGGRSHPNTLALLINPKLGKTPEWAAIQAKALARQ